MPIPIKLYTFNPMSNSQNSPIIYDNSFIVIKQRWGTYTSVSHSPDPEVPAKKLITSLTEEQCISSTRFYLKGLQDGEGTSEKTYDGEVGGKL